MSSVRANPARQPTRQYISAAPFNNDMFLYTVSTNSITLEDNIGVLTVVGATATTCPAGRILRENGQKLYPSGANPGISTFMVGVFDIVTSLTGYIDPNSPVYAVYSTDLPSFYANGKNPNPNGPADAGPPVYTNGAVVASTLSVYATGSISSLTVSSINGQTPNSGGGGGTQTNTYSTLSASTFTVSTIAFSTLSGVNPGGLINVSSLMVSSINGAVPGVSNQINTYSTLSASTFTVSTIAFSTMTGVNPGGQISVSSLSVSSINGVVPGGAASQISTFSALSASTFRTSTITFSSMMGVTPGGLISVSSIFVSSINGAIPGVSQTSTFSALSASTFTVSSITFSSMMGTNAGGFIGVSSLMVSSMTGFVSSGQTMPTTFSQLTGAAVTTNQFTTAVTTYNDGSAVISGRPSLDYSLFAVNWSQTTALNKNWTFICCSASGQYQSACIEQFTDIKAIYYSEDYGQHWTASNAPSLGWTDVSCSGSGQYQIACAYYTTGPTNGGIYYSSDYGHTWIASSANPLLNWSGLCMSTSGQYATITVLATALLPNSGAIYYSSDYGQNWINANVDNNKYWYFSCCSASGQYQSVIATYYPGDVGPPIKPAVPSGIYYSIDYGHTWTISNAPTNLYWVSICCSGTGQYQSACVSDSYNLTTPGYIYYSSDYGHTWTQCTDSNGGSLKQWQAIVCSAAGQYQLSVVYGRGMYYSSDYGHTWTQATVIPDQLWYYIACPSTAQYLSACSYGGGIWTSVTPFYNMETSAITATLINYADSSVALSCTPPLDYSQFGVTWGAAYSAASNAWRSICCSASGQYQAATVNPGYIYYSINYGQTWIATTNTSFTPNLTVALGWQSICCSASGKYQSAVVNGGFIYYSSNYGQNWTQCTDVNGGTSRLWTNICCSATGQYQSATVSGGYIYYSSNYGKVWAATTNASYIPPLTGGVAWTSICCSATGQYQSVIVDRNDTIGVLYSSNYGQTWTACTDTVGGSKKVWTDICCSASGQYQTSIVQGGIIYYTIDYGQTWAACVTPVNGVPNPGGTSLNWQSVCCSVSGQYQAAAVLNGSIYYSTDYGRTWAASTSSSLAWYSIGCSANGQFLTAIVGLGTIYTSVTPYPSLYASGNLKCLTLYGGSKNFEIAHPVYPERSLVHSCIEGPRADLIYRGSKALFQGTITVDINKECTELAECAMSDGTFESLCANPQIFLQNNSSFDRVIGTLMGPLLIIQCENAASSDIINWMVIAERKDSYMLGAPHTNALGRLITEPGP